MSGRTKLLFASALLAAFIAVWTKGDSNAHGVTTKLLLTSTAFADGQPIPRRHALDDRNISPALQWSGVPAATRSLALICDDPDAPAGTWVHWVIYDLPPDSAELAEDVPKSPELDHGARQGMNDFKRTGYGGPAPPPGKAHRYFFKLYALDLKPDLKPGLTKKDLLKATAGHVLAEGELMGTYQSKS